MELSRRSSILKPPKVREPLADVNLPCNRNEVTLFTPPLDVCRRSKVGFASIKIKEFGCEDKSIVVSVAPIFEKRICTPSDSSTNGRSGNDSASIMDDEICKCTNTYNADNVRISSRINGTYVDHDDRNKENSKTGDVKSSKSSYEDSIFGGNFDQQSVVNGRVENGLTSDLKRKVISNDERYPSVMSSSADRSPSKTSSFENTKRLKQDDSLVSNRFSKNGRDDSFEIIINSSRGRQDSNGDNNNNNKRRRTMCSLSNMSLTQIIEPHQEYDERSYITNKSFLNTDDVYDDSNNETPSFLFNDDQQTSVDRNDDDDISSAMQMTNMIDDNIRFSESRMHLTEVLDNSLCSTRYFESTVGAVAEKSIDDNNTKSTYEDMEVSYGETEYVYDDYLKSGKELTNAVDMVLTKVVSFNSPSGSSKKDDNVEEYYDETDDKNGIDDDRCEVIEKTISLEYSDDVHDDRCRLTATKNDVNDLVSVLNENKVYDDVVEPVSSSSFTCSSTMSITSCLKTPDTAISDDCNFDVSIYENLQNDRFNDPKPVPSDKNCFSFTTSVSKSTVPNSSVSINVSNTEENIRFVSMYADVSNTTKKVEEGYLIKTKENTPIVCATSNLSIVSESTQPMEIIEKSSESNSSEIIDIIHFTMNEGAHNNDDESVQFLDENIHNSEKDDDILSKNVISIEQNEIVNDARTINSISEVIEKSNEHDDEIRLSNVSSVDCRNFPKLIGGFLSSTVKKNRKKKLSIHTRMFDNCYDHNLSPLSEIMNKSGLTDILLETIQSNLEKEWFNGKQEWEIKEMKVGSWVFSFMKNDLEVEILYDVSVQKLGTVKKINFHILANESNFRNVVLKTLVRKYDSDKKTVALYFRLDEVPILLNRISTDVRFVKDVVNDFIYLSCKRSIKFTKEGFIFEVVSLRKILLVEIHVKMYDLNCIHPSRVEVKTIIGNVLYPYKITTLCVGLKDHDFASKFVEAVDKYIQEADPL